MNLLANLLFGHIVGDYFLQPKPMAFRKSKETPVALFHCFLVTLALCLFTHFSLLWVTFVFSTHFLIDRFGLAELWLQFINGRTLTGFCKWGHNVVVTDAAKDKEEAKLFAERAMNFRILDGGFTALVYFVVDNGAHLMLYWYGYPYFR